MQNYSKMNMDLHYICMDSAITYYVTCNKLNDRFTLATSA